MLSPEHADTHDDHFHIRISCPEAMRGTCVEESAARGTGAPSHIGAAAAAAGIDPSAPSPREPSSSSPGPLPLEKPDYGYEPGKPSDPPQMGD